MNLMGHYLTIMFVSAVILFVIFLLIREVMCWYWKVNVMIRLLQSIDAKLTPPSQTNMKDLLNTLK